MSEEKKEIFINADALRKELSIPMDVKIPEFKDQIECTKSEINKLKKDYESSKQDKVKSEEIISGFIDSKSKIKNDTQIQTKELKKGVEAPKTAKEELQRLGKLNEYMSVFSINGVKQSLEFIEKIEDKQSRGFATNFLLGNIEANGYQLHIDGDEMKVTPTFGKQDIELQTVLNNYIKKDKFKLDNFKVAILYGTTYFDAYAESNTDTKKNQLNENNNGRTYYNFLLEKYKLNDTLFLTVNDIKKNPNISPRDKSFLISYKEGAYDDFDIDIQAKQYNFELKQSQEAAAKLLKSHGKEAKSAFKNRDPKDVGKSLLRDPFSETMNIITSAGPIGGLAILAALIYSLWNYPRNTILALAAIGVGKGTGILDMVSDKIESGVGLNGTIDSLNGVLIGTSPASGKDAGKEVKLTPSQAAATEKVKADSNLVANVNKSAEKGAKKGKIEDYLSFINSPKFQENNLSKFVYPESREASIFSNSHSIDPSLNLPENLDPLMLKQIIRVYFGMDYKLGIPANGKQPGDAEFANFESKYIPKKKLEKEKKFSELLIVIYSKKA